MKMRLITAMASLLVSVALPAYAQTTLSPPAVMEQPLRDPWVPPAARKPSAAPPTQGAELRKQVEQKLKAVFETAAAAHSGSVTLAQAKAANLGLVVRHFDEIDVNHSGAVRFDDVKTFLKNRGANLD